MAGSWHDVGGPRSRSSWPPAEETNYACYQPARHGGASWTKRPRPSRDGGGPTATVGADEDLVEMGPGMVAAIKKSLKVIDRLEEGADEKVPETGELKKMTLE